MDFCIVCRDEVLHKVRQQLKSMETTLDTVNKAHRKEKQAWESDLHNLEETWRSKCPVFPSAVPLPVNDLLIDQVNWNMDLHLQLDVTP